MGRQNNQTFQVPHMEVGTSPIPKLYGYGLLKGKPTPQNSQKEGSGNLNHLRYLKFLVNGGQGLPDKLYATNVPLIRNPLQRPFFCGNLWLIIPKNP